jgi:hypothetical protein
VIQEDGLQAQKDADRSELVHYCPFPTPQKTRSLGTGDMERVGLNAANNAIVT